MIKIVLGTGFGDEGKGQAVHSLSHAQALVIRFSGGHQCGHTVTTKDGRRHIFSQFGAGTFQSAATYISQYCTVFPTAFRNEYEALKSINASIAAYYVHPLAMVTTPYDLAFNRAVSMITGHGTCGVGFGTTLQRNEDYYNLYANDLATPFVFKAKMGLIERYYNSKLKTLNMSSQMVYEQELESAWERWDEAVELYQNIITIADFSMLTSCYTNYIFEGSQGIMLDQHFGFFPHVTRSNTTAKNALEIIQNSELRAAQIHTYYVSRCYQTRHGNGPFPDEESVALVNVETESNKENDWQGKLRVARFDPLAVQHAISCDRTYNTTGKRRLIFTCFDQLADKDSFTSVLNSSSLRQQVDEVLIKDSPDWE